MKQDFVNRKSNILIVDDSVTVLDFLSTYLHSQGYKTISANSGSAAIRKIKSHLPDLILLDICMPEMDGYQTCREIKSNKNTKDIPVIFLSALTETSNKLAGFLAGGVDYITKPLDQAETIARIKTHLTISAMRKELVYANNKLLAAQNELQSKNDNLEVHVNQRTSELEKANKEIKANERLLFTIADNYPNSYLLIIEKNFTIGFAAGQEFKKQNLDSSSYIGLSIEQVFMGNANYIRQYFEKTFAGKEQTFELITSNHYQLYKTVPLYSDNGIINKILSVAENITERKNVENELKRHRNNLEQLVNIRSYELEKTEARLKSLFTYMPNGFAEAEIILDQKGNPIDFLLVNKNPAFEKFVFTRDKDITKTKITSDFSDILIQKYVKVVLSGKSISFDYFLKSTNKYLRVLVFSNRKGCFAVLIDDITLQKQQEKKLKRINMLANQALDLTNASFWTMNFSEPDYFYSSDKLVKILGLPPMPQNKYCLTDYWYNTMAVVDKEMADQTMKIFKNAISENLRYNVVFRAKRLDNGKIEWVKAIGDIVKDENGKPQNLNGVIQVVTAQKLQEIEIIDSRQRLSSLFENMPNGFSEQEAIYNENGKIIDFRIQYINPAMKNFMGFSNDVIGKTFKEINTEVNENSIKILEEVAITGKNICLELYSKLMKRNFRIHSFSNRKGHLAILFDDITESKEQETEIKQAHDSLNMVLESAQIGIWNLYVAEDRLEFDVLTEKVYGMKPRTFDGSIETWLSRIHPEDLSRVNAKVQYVLNNYIHDYKDDYRIVLPNGELRYVLTKGAFVFDEDKKPLTASGLIWEITEQFKAENALKQSKEQMELATKSANLGMWDWRPNTNELFTNDNWETMLGYEPNSFSNTADKFFNLIHPDDKEETNKAINLHIEGQTDSYRNEYRLKTNDGKWKWILGVGRIAERNDKHQVTRFMGFHIDINESKQFQMELTEAKFKAEQANRLKSEFLANMSHEIRTPMNAVLGFAEILSSKLSGKPEYKAMVQGIIQGGRNLIDLINDILDLSKIEAGYLKIKQESINLFNLIEDIKQIFAVKTKSKNLQFLLNIDQKLPKSLMLDQTRIRQILFNLVGNSIKFTDTGFVAVNVKIKDNTPSNNLIDLYLEVEDSGIGIPKNQIDKIFEAFRQTEGQLVKYGGTGLGLSITKRLIQAMNGEISIESESGKGSVFRILLKNVVVPSIDVMVETEVKQKSIGNIKFDKLIVLLVDDIKSNRDIIKYNLTELNCKIYEAENGKEAIDFLKTNKPDFILMDIQMPVMDGFKATCFIKQQKHLSSIPVVALTALAMKDQEEKYREVFDDYLKKPIKIVELIQCMIKFIPYTKFEKQENYNIEDSYSNAIIAHIKDKGSLPSEFIQILNNEILRLYEDLIDILDTDDCNDFASLLIATGNEFDIKPITKFGTEFMYAANNIQLSEMERLLEEFSEIIKIFKIN